MTGQASAPLVKVTCTETDGGDFPNVPGIMNYAGRAYKDTCSGNRLTEYYCQNPQTAKSAQSLCANGCKSSGSPNVGDACSAPAPTPPLQPSSLKAESCDADGVCEMNSAQVGKSGSSGPGVISSAGPDLFLQSQTGNIFIVGPPNSPGFHNSGNLFAGEGQFANIKIKDNEISTTQGAPIPLVLGTGSGEVIIQDRRSQTPGPLGKIVAGEAQIGSLLVAGKTVTTNPGSTSSLVLTSDTKEVIVDDRLSTKHVETTTIRAGILYANAFKLGEKSGCNPALVYGSGLSQNPCDSVNVNTEARFTNLVGVGNAYACLDASGILFRSDTPCK